MYCPSCGKDGPLDQKFCRACGFQMEQVAELLEPQSSRVAAQDLAQFKLRHIGSIVVISTISLALFAVCGSIVWAMVAGAIPILFGIIGLLILLGMTSGFIFLSLSQLKAEKAANQSLPGAERTFGGLLNQQPVNIPPSVTERTTNLLPIERTK